MNSTNIDYLKEQWSLPINAAKKAGKILIEAQNKGIVIHSSFNKDIKLEADIESENNIAIWVAAAGLAIVVTAGGTFTAFEGKGPN